jgi:hypothetical protein
MLLQAFRQSWSSSALGSIDMSLLSSMADPQMVVQAQKDPQFYKVGTRLDTYDALSAVQLQAEHLLVPHQAGMWQYCIASSSWCQFRWPLTRGRGGG